MFYNTIRSIKKGIPCRFGPKVTIKPLRSIDILYMLPCPPGYTPDSTPPVAWCYRHINHTHRSKNSITAILDRITPLSSTYSFEALRFNPGAFLIEIGAFGGYHAKSGQGMGEMRMVQTGLSEEADLAAVL